MSLSFSLLANDAKLTMEIDMNSIRKRLRTEQAAKYCGLSKSTFDKYRLTGKGPIFLKLGRIIVYDTLDLNNWLQNNRRRSTAEYNTNFGEIL